jgi:hypothetical protein
MSFQWQMPNPSPDPSALQRMRQHFLLPPEPMPEAWFMSGEVNLFTWLYEMPPDELMKNRRLCEVVFREIASGLNFFPKVSYVKDWRAWFKYLLPSAILHAQAWNTHVLVLALNAFMAVYPDGIIEEYSGFRQDVVYTLGTRFIPEKLSRDELPNPNFQHVQNPVFNDLWDETGYMGMEYPGVGDEPGLAMFFCLKYLTSQEIVSWVDSIIRIKSPQWYLTVITWWLAFNQFLKLVQNWPQNGKLKDYFEATELIKYASLQLRSFNSFNDLIPHQNLDTFNAELSRQLTFDVFQLWAAEIRSHRTIIVDGETYPLAEDTIRTIEDILADFEMKFFNSLS